MVSCGRLTQGWLGTMGGPVLASRPPRASLAHGPTQRCPSADHVAVTIRLHFKRGNVFLTSHQYPFYDCREAMSLQENLP